MNCASCGFQVESGFAFCPKCGARQPRECQSCGYLCAPDFAFCPKCGAGVGNAAAADGRGAPASPALRPQARIADGLTANGIAVNGRSLQPADLEADRRTVTVLFADLTGFTSLSEQLDPEVMQSLQNELFEELTAAVQ